jgi:hypothetical protein
MEMIPDLLPKDAKRQRARGARELSEIANKAKKNIRPLSIQGEARFFWETFRDISP